jgi:hypothetical protein
VACGKFVASTALNPCVVQHETYRTVNDPYYQHMPRDNAAEATLYAARLGGEDHEPSMWCNIL